MSGPTQHYDWGNISGDAPPESTRPERLPVPAHVSSDIGLLVLRLVVGASFAAAGARKLFGVAGGIGLDASAAALADAGFVAFAGPLAWVLAVGQLVSGVLLVLGLLTPFAAAGLLATKIVAVTVALVPVTSVPLFASDGANSLELDLLLGAGAAALVFAGAGRIALDAGRTYQRRPLPWAVLSLVVGVAVALLVLFVLRR
ncbi:Membrane protein 2, distant similarity to thiosulfate:quinone oxidoreductase DoxD [Pseudonocardia sp. Ae717_Ps2]|uniref:DoxX family protein n=1 Tax=unclassified Pseudonocardia TaxID=2619320 RepID=UPI00094ABB53|nr:MULTISPECIES: DoxX family protein [unclassified Pseudonocardia]OLM10029.1 Membrane protein 2, distant similarity to thiosulfate:quinone oxidoreductase DoxD [Pseudonocardia sp. Ae505_Ps2]OLM33203.1 Membrane protein 2, distant similarity to thiosulfate:quinone oxidoreductase DoxD [Pseudonocardia sp. Ae717_Ps2]